MNGAPMSKKETSRYKNLGPLHDLLLLACPLDARGKRSIPALAKAIGVSHQYIYRWIKDEDVPSKFVGRIITLSNGRVTLEQFHPYVF